MVGEGKVGEMVEGKVEEKAGGRGGADPGAGVKVGKEKVGGGRDPWSSSWALTALRPSMTQPASLPCEAGQGAGCGSVPATACSERPAR